MHSQKTPRRRNSSLAYNILRFVSGRTSELVADGRIKLKSGVGVERLEEYSIIFTDGSELPADLIVFATGYGSMNGWVEQLISKEVANKVGKCWGLGSDTRYDPGPWEGELHNMWKPTHQEALWFHGGNLQPTFLPDGKSILFLARTENNAGNRPIFSLWQAGANGHNARQIAASGLFTAPSKWKPKR